MTSNRPTLRLLAVFVAVTSLLVSTPSKTAFAEDPWNQEIVLSIAQNLESSVKDLRAIARKATSQNQRRQERLVKLASEELKKVQSATRQLVGKLKAGKGRDETLSYIKRIDMHRNETAIYARRAAVSASTQAKLAAANGLIKELEYYYYTTDLGGDDMENDEE